MEEDAFLFKFREPHQPYTKRGILPAVNVSSLYNPMGFVCQVVLEAKHILQRLSMGWDDKIPEELQSGWNRSHPVDSAACDVSLHLLSDASEESYGMSTHLRFVYASGTIRCSFSSETNFNSQP